MTYLLTFCNTEERITQNTFIHNSNRTYKIINYNNNNNNINLETDRLYKLQKAMPRTRVLLYSKTHQLGWLKIKQL